MTARHAILVHCDHEGCDQVVTTLGAQSPTTGRADAGLKGWTKHLKENGHDYVDTCPQPHLAAAAPAVERATPDPDTLRDVVVRASTGRDGWSSLSRTQATDLAHALIAAGVTLNETTPFEAGDTMAAGSKLAASNFRRAEAIFKSTDGPGAKVLPTAHLRGPLSRDPSAVVLWINDECAILRADHLTTIIAALTDARDDVVAHDATRTATTPTQEDA